MSCRIIVTGCRRWRCDELAARVVLRLLERYGADELIIVHGGAPGVDSAFVDACNNIGVTHEPHPADWQTHGKGAGPRRNQEMVDAGASICLAFHPDLAASKGTKDCVRRALKAGIPTWWTNAKDSVPIRQRSSE